MKNVQERFETLKSMNTIIKSMNDEGAYIAWIYIIPDGADDDELMEIAEEDEESFEDAVHAFMEIMNKRLNRRFCIVMYYIKTMVKVMYTKYKTGKRKTKI